MRPFLTSSMMSEIFPTCSPSDDMTLFPSSVAAAMMSGPGPSPMPPPTMSAPRWVSPCGLIEPMIHLLQKRYLNDAQAVFPVEASSAGNYRQSLEGIGCHREPAGAGTLTRVCGPDKRFANSELMASSKALRSTGFERKTFQSVDFSSGGIRPEAMTT